MKRILSLALTMSVFSMWACETSVPPILDPGVGPTDRVDLYVPPEMGTPDGGTPVDTGVSIDMAIDAEPDVEVDAAAFDVIAYAVETRVGDRRTAAGIENRVTCQVLDQVGEPILDQQARPEVLPDNGFERVVIQEERLGMCGMEDDAATCREDGDCEDGIVCQGYQGRADGLIGHIARDYEIVCSSRSLGLRDPTPAIWTVTPSRAHRVVTRLNREQMDAGEIVDITCEAFDIYGNAVASDEFEIEVTPPPQRMEQVGQGYRFESAGRFAVSCNLSGAEEIQSVALDVEPGLPAAIGTSLFPDRGVYQSGSVVELVPLVTDRYGNAVEDVDLSFTNVPAAGNTSQPLPAFGEGRYRCQGEGPFDLRVQVTSETWQARELLSIQRIIVDLGGPGIACDAPALGEVIIMPQGGIHTLYGSVADTNGVESVTVDGEAVEIERNGDWEAEVPVRWGLNVHQIVANDGENETSTFCAYYAAENFADGEQPLNDGLIFRLGQGAVDDGAPDAPLSSLGDTLRRMINSQGLQDTVDEAARAQNPIVPNECRVRALGICLFRFGAEYTGYENRGPNNLTLTLIDDGFRVRTVFREQRVGARFLGTLGNRARMRAEHITIDMTFGIGLRFNGQPDVWVREVNEVSVGDLDANFSGLLGFIFELVFEAFEGLVRRTVVDQIRDFMADNVDRVLSDLFGNIDIGALSQGFEVPSLTGGPPIPVVMNAGLSTIDFDPDRARLGIFTRVDAPIVLPDRGLGMPLLPGFDALALPEDGTVGLGVRLGIVNQIMYRLWRAGYFQAEGGGLVETLNADLPEGVEVFLRLAGPPWVTGFDGESRVRVYLGPVSAGVRYPGFFEEPIRVRTAAVIDAGVRIEGDNDVVFEDVSIEELHLGLGGAEMPIQAREVLQNTLSAVIQRLIDRTLNAGLPVIPLPEFMIPQGLAEFDLPVGRGLGLRQPRLSGREAAWFLDGNFGE